MKIILNVPYEEKDLVKALHGRWDGKSWYIPEGVDYHPFRKWIDPKTYQSLEAPLNIDDLLLQYKKRSLLRSAHFKQLSSLGMFAGSSPAKTTNRYLLIST
jgi:traC